MAKAGKTGIISFKADESLAEAMRGVRNRSEFIRAAVLAALESACPLCGGSGVLTPRQREHWRTFAEEHSLRTCGECHETHLVCGRAPKRRPSHRKRA